MSNIHTFTKGNLLNKKENYLKGDILKIIFIEHTLPPSNPNFAIKCIFLEKNHLKGGLKFMLHPPRDV